MRRLCRAEALAPGTSCGFGPPAGGFTGLFAVRTLAGAVRVYVNACPHIGVALDWSPGDVLTRDRTRIVCAAHGALFDPDSGLCVDGPCEGDRLQAVPSVIEGGWLLVSEAAGL